MIPRRCGVTGAVLFLVACSDPDVEADHCSPPEAGSICTLVGTGSTGMSGEDIPALQAELHAPADAALGPDGLLYVVDWNNHRIRVVAEDGRVRTVAGTGTLGDGPAGLALDSALDSPMQVVFDALGRMVVAAWHNSKVKRVDLGAGTIEDICGTGKRAYTGDGGPAAQADLDLPAALALDAQQNLYIMDQANQMIRRVDASLTIERFAGQCIIGTCDEGEVPTACPDSSRLSCLVDNVPATACVKPCGTAFTGDNGPALEARLAQPVGQAADPAGRMVFDTLGNLIFADTMNHRVRSIDSNGIVRTIAGNGQRGKVGDGGPATLAELDHPTDVDVGLDGTLYIADTYNSCVRSVDPGGVIQTLAGVCGQHGFSGDGRAGTALLNRPYGIAVDSQGNLYIADTLNHRIRRVMR